MKKVLYKRVFGTLANDVRLDILIALRSGRKNVNELARELKNDQSAVSHGLTRLTRDGLVLATTQGRFRYYSLRSGRFEMLMNVIGQFVGEHSSRAAHAGASDTQRLYRMVDSFPHAVMVESDGKIAYLNRAGVAMFGASSAFDLIGREVLSLVTPRSRSVVKERIMRLRHGAESNPLLKEEWFRFDGTRFSATVSSSRYRLNKRVGAIAVIRSMT